MRTVHQRRRENGFSRFSEGLAQYRKNGGLLLDVRERPEYRKGHIAGAVNLPTAEIEGFLRRYPNRSLPVYVYCRSGRRSREAAAYLRRHGYRKVTDLGGFWENEK